MVHVLRTTTKKLTVAASLCALFALGAWAQDPPSRVARLNYTNGNVSMEPAGVDDWAPAERNRPFSTGDYLYTDQGAQAELHLDVAVMRLGSQTSFGFLNLDNQTVQLKLSEGEMYFRVRNFGQNQVFEVDTPNAAITLLQNGVYTVSVDANANTSFLVVREGQAQVTGGGQAFTVDQGSSVNLSGTDQLAYDVEAAPEPDEFENWSGQRDQHETNLRSSRYLPPTVIGYEDLDDNGGWQASGQYGNVWYPNNVDPGWAPYHNGHWGWQDPWGYTWIDDAPWGFAPFHYGRWAYISNRWGWCPGPIGIGYGGPVVQPYYAPALVAFFGGSNFGVSIGVGFGGGESLGWVPLGYGEVYTPSYAVSQSYFRQVNISNTRITNVTNITNVYNNVYVNHTAYNQAYANTRAPNAVMAMPQSAFASGRQVRQAARPVPASAVSRLQSAAIVAPRVAPTRQALIPNAGRGPAPRPSAQVMQRQVVARVKPPAPPVPFAAKQAYLQQHAGQPYNHAAVRQAVAPRTTATAAAVRVAPAARPVAVKPGQRAGNVAAMPASRPGQPAAAGRPGQPAPAARPGQPAPAARPGQPAAAGRPGQPAPATRPRQPAPAARPGQPAAAGHGAPPNMRQGAPANTGRPGEPAAARTGERAPAAQPAGRPGQPTPAARPGERAPATQPESRTAQPTPSRGTPPNMRQGNAGQPAAAHPAERPAPAAQPAARPETRPAPAARPESRPAPAAQPAARPESRPAPAARPETRPAPAARPQTQPAPTARPEARPAPAARPDSKPAPAARPESRPAPQHGTPPPARPERSTKDTKEH